MKILVTGNAGSGKSTLGGYLSKKHNIPLYSLDKIVWKENWQPTPKEERQKLIREIISKDEWIIEGVSKDALEKADLIYFLNLPHYKCVLNIIKRFAKNGFKTREGLPNNCPEYIGFLKAIRVSYLYEKQSKPWIVKGLKNKKSIEVKSHNGLLSNKF